MFTFPSRSLGQASHPTMPVSMTPNVRNRDHGVVKQTNKQTNFSVTRFTVGFSLYQI